MKVTSRLLVIDTDIGRACGESERSSALRCLMTLQAVLKICHRVVLTETLNEEWRRHASHNRRFALWWSEMTDREKVMRIELGDSAELTEQLVRHGHTEDERKQIAKDVHLLAAALRGDLCILSMDERARRRYRQAASSLNEIASICWVNPSKESEGVIPWLEAGAPAESHRQLGNSG